MKRCKISVLFFALFCLCMFFSLYGEESTESYLKEAEQAQKEESYKKAADAYKDAAHMADVPTVKANALIKAVVCYRNAGLYGKEFDCIQQLITDYINHVDFKRAINREFEIADLFFEGHRDYIVSWLPFIKDKDRTVEIYEMALKNAACAEQAPSARLRLGAIYLDEEKPDRAIVYFRDIIALNPESKEARYAYLELARAYVMLSERGDGDGAWTNLASEALRDFIKKYPDDPEIPWAKRSLDRVNTIAAERLYGIGKYYHRTGRDDLAERYLSRVVQKYGISNDSEKSEKLLAEIDKTYQEPPDSAPRKDKYVHKYERHTIPLEKDSIMVVPENSQGKWLLPIKDLKGDISHESGKTPIEKKEISHEF